jgi:eukaryotic-like serine/threonine-protein kinase
VFVVSELLVGRTLRALLAAGLLPPRKAIDYSVQLARGLAAAHAAGIIHRDLKPENVFVTHDERVKILDFGLAKQAGAAFSSPEDPTGEIGMTTPGTILGTIGYMSPEQVRGSPVDRRSDIFAFGAVLYEMLCGRRAFVGASAADVLSAILNEEPPVIREAGGDALVAAADRIARRCVAKRPEARFQNSADLAFALETLDPWTAPPPAIAGRRRPWRPALTGAAIAVLLAAGVAWWARGIPREPVSYQRLTFRKGVVTSARFAEEGRTVVYSAEWGGEPSRLFVTRLDNPESRSLGFDGRLQSISASGDISFTHGFKRGSMPGLLARVPLAGGAPRDVAESVIAAEWTADGDHVLVRQQGNQRPVEWPAGRVVHLDGGYRMRVSPDGERVATVERIGTGVRMVVVNRSGAVVTRSRTFVGLTGLAWSGNGKDLWFSGTDATGPSSIRSLDVHGADRIILRLPGSASLYDRSPDGRLLVSEVDWRAAVMYAEAGLRDRDLSWMDWSMPADLSADGRTVLFTEAREAGGPGGAVYLRRVDEPAPVRLGDGDALALSPDGHHALSVRRSTPPQLVLWTTGAGAPVPLPTLDLQYQQVRFLPGGQRFLFVGRSGVERKLYLQDTAGRAPSILRPTYASNGFAVSPDGTRVALVEEGQALAYPIDSGAPQPLAGVPADTVVVGWSSDGRSVFVTRGEEGVQTTVLRTELLTGRTFELRRLEVAEGRSISPVLVSGDGTRVVYGLESSASKLFVISGVTGEP